MSINDYSDVPFINGKLDISCYCFYALKTEDISSDEGILPSFILLLESNHLKQLILSHISNKQRFLFSFVFHHQFTPLHPLSFSIFTLSIPLSFYTISPLFNSTFTLFTPIRPTPILTIWVISPISTFRVNSTNRQCSHLFLL